MSNLANLNVPKLETVTVTVEAPGTIRWRGTITSKDPGKDLAEFTRAAHCAAMDDGLSELKVDVSELTFVNSSAIRLFIDWATWVRDTKGCAYKLRFATSRRVTWQRTSFTALRSLAGQVLSVEHVD
jgi:hypothetical protein